MLDTTHLLREARLGPPRGIAHDLEPGCPLVQLARRDGDVSVGGGQDGDGRAPTVGDSASWSVASTVAGLREFAHGHAGQGFLDRDVDHVAFARALPLEQGVQSGAHRRDSGNKRRLLPDCTQRGHRGRILHRTGQQPGDPAGGGGGEVGGGVVTSGAAESEGCDVDEDCSLERERLRREMEGVEVWRIEADERDARGGDRRAQGTPIGVQREPAHGLASVEKAGEGAVERRIDRRHRRTEVGQQAAGDGGSKAWADLQHLDSFEHGSPLPARG